MSVWCALSAAIEISRRKRSRQKVTATIKGNGIKALVTARVHGHFSGKNVTGTEKTSARIDDKYGRHNCKTFVRFTAKR